jgi:purine-binding chemotaxis protein CheW
MSAEDIVRAIEGMPGQEVQEESAAGESLRFFIFSVGDAYFALPPESVREIVSDLEIFPLPACPPYIPGLINCHGTPHTVFSLMVLFRNERDTPAQFLVLNLPDDHVAFGCTEAIEIATIPAASISTFPEGDAGSRHFTGLFPFSGQRVPVLSVPEILRQLELDLG